MNPGDASSHKLDRSVYRWGIIITAALVSTFTFIARNSWILTTRRTQTHDIALESLRVDDFITGIAELDPTISMVEGANSLYTTPHPGPFHFFVKAIGEVLLYRSGLVHSTYAGHAIALVVFLSVLLAWTVVTSLRAGRAGLVATYLAVVFVAQRALINPVPIRHFGFESTLTHVNGQKVLFIALAVAFVLTSRRSVAVPLATFTAMYLINLHWMLAIFGVALLIATLLVTIGAERAHQPGSRRHHLVALGIVAAMSVPFLVRLGIQGRTLIEGAIQTGRSARAEEHASFNQLVEVLLRIGAGPAKILLTATLVAVAATFVFAGRGKRSPAAVGIIAASLSIPAITTLPLHELYDHTQWLLFPLYACVTAAVYNVAVIVHERSFMAEDFSRSPVTRSVTALVLVGAFLASPFLVGGSVPDAGQLPLPVTETLKSAAGEDKLLAIGVDLGAENGEDREFVGISFIPRLQHLGITTCLVLPEGNRDRYKLMMTERNVCPDYRQADLSIMIHPADHPISDPAVMFESGRLVELYDGAHIVELVPAS